MTARRVLAYSVTVAGMVGIVLAVYAAIVLGLGRAPAHDERALLGLSAVASVFATFLCLAAHGRLARFGERLVHAERTSPDDVLRKFGRRLTLALPLDELLLQLVETLREEL